MQRSLCNSRSARRGNALLMSLVAIVGLTGIAGAILASSLSTKKEVTSAVDRTRALYAAEAGVSAALSQLTAGTTPNLGSASAPVSVGTGAYYGDVVNNGDGSFTVTSVGAANGVQRAVQAVISRPSGGVFDNAVFAGNSSNNPTYDMLFGGTGAAADRVIGDMYSGNRITFAGNATIDGIPRAFDSFTGPAGAILPDAAGLPRFAETGTTQGVPDFAGMNYATTADVNVGAAFASATYASSGQGGSAYQLPRTNVAHIFRKHPSDRRTNWTATPKEDYFLEDPYQTLRSDSTSDGSDCNRVQLNNPSLSGYGTRSGNKLVYYIDGNLWVHNNSTMSFQLRHGDAQGIQVTFIVKGNVYISDNLYYKDAARDGIAFVTLKDSAVTDSGNIYFGDPSFGTLIRMDSYMYAENNFIDNNLDASGSLSITVKGIMTAGNQVAINRDSGGHHSKMTVVHDTRVSAGVLTLPGLPSAATSATTGYVLSMMREVAVP